MQELRAGLAVPIRSFRAASSVRKQNHSSSTVVRHDAPQASFFLFPSHFVVWGNKCAAFLRRRNDAANIETVPDLRAQSLPLCESLD